VKKISIVTPCFNSETYIAETMRSILTQTALVNRRVELEYIICDGKSKDRTLDIIQAVRDSSEFRESIQVISESDSGMYDALTKGLTRVTGEIVAYLNAGDYYHPHAFEVVLDVFETQNAEWLTGYSVFYNDQSQVIEVNLPFRYRQELFACGFYGKQLPAVQQESTFWLASLHRLIDFERFSKLRYAGDYYLWLQFSQACELKIVKSYLGGFRFHTGQLSSHNTYDQEKQQLVRPPSPTELMAAKLDRILWAAPYRIKKKLNPQGIFAYNTDAQQWQL
jgi:glycosyltransferase involved in cell wall biosynthesis